MRKPNKGIAVDGWCSGNPGKGGYKAVDISTGKKLFEWSCDYTTNNLVEFIAIVHAMMWCEKYRPNEIIWTDSMTAISWVSNKKARTKIDFTKASDIQKRVEVCNTYLKQKSHPLKKWMTKEWGEIPADFGRK